MEKVLTVNSDTDFDHARPPSDTILYGNETVKAVENFAISGTTMPREFISALGLLKCCCAEANLELGLLDERKSNAIQRSAEDVYKGLHYNQFPVDVYQTGSGTSTNMNSNEVIASLASLILEGEPVHPNDDVNKGQSSNDVIPSCIHISAALSIRNKLLPALSDLENSLDTQATRHKNTIKTGRTHLMDAMPISFGQEISGWSAQVSQCSQSVLEILEKLSELAIGGTAVGTGVNTHPRFAKLVTSNLEKETDIRFKPSENYFCSISSQDTALSASGHLKTLAVCLYKITNDIRWMSSGPLNGLNEVTLPEVQKGSSIMPGKVNPVIPESILMACTQVIGNDATITLAAQSGNFQLNTMLPLIATTLLQSINLLTTSCIALNDKVIRELMVNTDKIAENLSRNPILATGLNDLIGYDKSAAVAKQAYLQQRTILDVALEMTDLSEDILKSKLDPRSLAGTDGK